MKWLEEHRKDLKALGPVRYWAMIVATVLFFVAWVISAGLAADQIGWPEAYGVECRRRCTLQWIFYSPKLLLDRSLPAIGMFALIWLPLPAFFWLTDRLGLNPKLRKRR